MPLPRRPRRLRFHCLPVLAAALLAHPAAAQAKVQVLYAGSLVNLMEHGVGPAFTRATGDSFDGFAAGSGALANQIKGKLRQADVFISAAPAVNQTLMGQTNGDWVRWYASFAHSPLVIGYSTASTFAAALKTKPWYEVLAEPGIRIGRTDPKLDPKGKLTLTLLENAERVYKKPGLSKDILGAAENAAQVFPEETLVGRLQSGQLDVGFFYSTETADLKIPFITLPRAVALQAQYTITIPRDAPDPAAAAKFVDFLLGPQGSALMRAHGLDLSAPVLSGDAKAVPKGVTLK